VVEKVKHTENTERGKMETLLILIGLVLCGIISTVIQMLITNRKEERELTELFEEISSN
jgi:hypothetical protein